MPKFVIERNIPGAGKLTPEDLNSIAKKSCGAIAELGPQFQWVESFVTADKVYCVYIAPDEAAIQQHGTMTGFPVNAVAEIHTVIDPTTAD